MKEMVTLDSIKENIQKQILPAEITNNSLKAYSDSCLPHELFGWVIPYGRYSQDKMDVIQQNVWNSPLQFVK